MEGEGTMDAAVLGVSFPSELPLILDLSSWMAEALDNDGLGVWKRETWVRKSFGPGVP